MTGTTQAQAELHAIFASHGIDYAFILEVQAIVQDATNTRGIDLTMPEFDVAAAAAQSGLDAHMVANGILEARVSK